MMIRPDTLAAIRAGAVDLAFRRWDRPRVVVGTRLRTRVGLVEVTSVDKVAPSRITADEARRAGATSVGELRRMLEAKADRPVWRVGLRHAGADPREQLRASVPDADEVSAIRDRLDRLDRASASARGRGRPSRSSTGSPRCGPPSSRPSWGATPRASSVTSASSRSSA